MTYDLTRERFGRAAGDYARSALFAEGKDRDWLVNAARARLDDTALDLGTGAGHTAFALAPHVRFIIGLDITPAMIETAVQLAGGRGLANFAGLLANSEELPCADASCEIVACRYVGHHFHRPARVLREVERVLSPGGRFAFIDNTPPEDPVLVRWINTVDRLRDPSHVHQRPRSAWERLFCGAGLSFESLREWRTPLELSDWTARQRTPPDVVAEIRTMLAEAEPAVREAFAIEDSRFALHTSLMRGIKPGG